MTGGALAIDSDGAGTGIDDLRGRGTGATKPGHAGCAVGSPPLYQHIAAATVKADVVRV